MSKAIRCDRCGKYYELVPKNLPGTKTGPKYSVNYFKQLGNSASEIKSFDLCPECAQQLTDWAENPDHNPTTITKEAAIDRLYKLGWLQEHDKVLTETNIRIGYDAAMMKRANIAEIIEQVRREYKEEEK